MKEILLFRSLDSEQLNEVLDAMFERKVAPNEYIIKQGDDGDNFYVVERLVIRQSLGSYYMIKMYWVYHYISVDSANSIVLLFIVERTTFL